MKRILSLALVSVLLVGMLFALTSCGQSLSGSYQSADGDRWTFSGNTVSIRTEKINEDGVTEYEYTEGTYRIFGVGSARLIFLRQKGSSEEMPAAFDTGEDENGEYIIISTKKYYKV